MYFKEQLKKGFFSVEFAFVVLITIITLGIPGEEAIVYDDDFLTIFISIQGNSIIALIFPMLVCLPLAIKYVSEYNSGYFSLIAMKMSVRKYTWVKLVCNGIVGGTAIAFPTMLYIIRLIYAKGFNVGLAKEATWPISILPQVYEESPLLYGIILIVGVFITGATFATIGLGIAATFKKSYLVLLIPLAYYILSAIVFAGNLRYFDATSLYVLNSHFNNNLLLSFVYAMMLFAIGTTMFVQGVKKNVM
ncbi:MAG: hypothetical protein RSI06_09625 [Lachnospiraceae bacterium]